MVFDNWFLIVTTNKWPSWQMNGPRCLEQKYILYSCIWWWEELNPTYLTPIQGKFYAKAIKYIARYLAQNPNKGLITKQDGTFDLKCRVDANYPGLYSRESIIDPKSVKLRYGYIVTFGEVPLIWKSYLILEIYLSTIQAEYVGLTNTLSIHWFWFKTY